MQKDIVRLIEKFKVRYFVKKRNIQYLFVYRWNESIKYPYVWNGQKNFLFNHRKNNGETWSSRHIYNIKTGSKKLCELSRKY